MKGNFLVNFTRANILPAIVTAALTKLVFNDIGKWVSKTWSIDDTFFTILIFICVLLLLQLIAFIAELPRLVSLSSPTIKKPRKLNSTFQGLIVLASFTGINSPAHAALKHHWNNWNGNLEYFWIICGGPKSLDAAREFLRDELNIFHTGKFEYVVRSPDNKDRLLRVFIKNIPPPNHDDPYRVFQVVNKIYSEAYRKFDIDESQIIADYTGGTKGMTSGLTLACTNPTRKLEFMKPNDYSKEGYAIKEKGSDATEVQIAFQLKPIKK